MRSCLTALLVAGVALGISPAAPVAAQGQTPVQTVKGEILDEINLYTRTPPSATIVVIRPFAATDADIVDGDKKDETKKMQEVAPRMLAEVLAPNTRRLYWKGYIELAFERIDIATEFAVEPKLVPQLITLGASGFKAKVTGADVYGVQVPQFNVGVLYVDGKLHAVLEAGLTAYWRFGRDLRVEFVDLRLQVIEVAGQEILTKDKVPLRVNLSAGYRVSDVVTAFGKQAKPVDYLYKELQFGLRAAVGTRSLDELLENKGLIDQVVAEHIARRVEGFGLEVDSVGVKDIILPGEMKVILAKVVEAEKAALANVIRRREETSATRSLLNTARVMEDNPTALRLKELETLEKVTEKIDKISVFGGLDAVLKDLVKIR